MFATLRVRLTFWYVLAAAVLVAVVFAVSTTLVYSLIVKGANESAQNAVLQATQMARVYGQEHRTIADSANDIVAAVHRPTLRVVIFDAKQTPIAGSDPTLVERFRGNFAKNFKPGSGEAADQRLIYATAAMFGVQAIYRPFDGGAIFVSINPRAIEGRLFAFGIAMLTMGVVAVLLAFFLARYITSQALQPLLDVTAALQRLSEGDFTPRMVVTKQRNELGALASAYNGAVDQVASAFEERLRNEEYMRRFIADAGHELRTPLTVVMGYLDVLRRGALNDPVLANRVIETMMSESRRMRMLIDKLILLARMEQPEQYEITVVDVSALATKVVDSLGALDPGGRLRLSVDPDAFVVADAGELQEAMINLVDNALKYTTTEVTVTVATTPATVTIEIADDGVGMSADEQLHVFERFYRGSASANVEGTGLGLAIAKRAVERANGEIALFSRPGAGTRFVITIARVTHESEAENNTAAAPAAPSQTHAPAVSS